MIFPSSEGKRFVKLINSGLVCTILFALYSSPAKDAFAQEVGSKPTLRAGFGRSDITPKIPTPMAGYYHVRMSTETHDPLWAKATVLDDGQQQVAIVAVDLISTTPWMVTEARTRIRALTGIPAQNVLIGASHSHTGPVLYDPRSARSVRFASDTPESKRFMLELPEAIAQSVVLAQDSLADVHVTRGVGHESQLAFNRRFFMKDGSVGWNPGKMNPNIVREAGPTDDQLPFLFFSKSPEQIVGVLANYSIHLDTVGGTQWSADMPSSFERILQQVHGQECHVQYSTGCCGDVNHIDVRTALPQKGHGEAARIGARLCGALLRAWPTMKDVDDTKLMVTSEIVRLPLAPIDQDKLPWAKEIADKSTSANPPAFMDMVEAFRMLDVVSRAGEPWEVEVQVITLGKEVAWVSLPGEIFVQLGLAIKDASPFEVTSIHELANGSIGYIPTRQAYSQGNYEVISARCAEGSGELLVDAALRQLRAHYQAKIKP